MSRPLPANGLSTDILDNYGANIGSLSTQEQPDLSAITGTLDAPWHPKLTLYRLLVIATTVGPAIAKAVTSYWNLTYASITLEWIFGVVVFLFLEVLGTYEDSPPPQLAWLFRVDCMEYIWTFVEAFTSINRPFYLSDERNVASAPGIVTSETPPILTGYRILVTLVVATIGTLKWVLLAENLQVEATTTECIFGGVIATCLYWLGLYEESANKVYPTFFHTDYMDYLIYAGELFLHLLSVAFAIAWLYKKEVLSWFTVAIDPSGPFFESLVHMLVIVMEPCASYTISVFISSMLDRYRRTIASVGDDSANTTGTSFQFLHFLMLGILYILRIFIRLAVQTTLYAARLSSSFLMVLLAEAPQYGFDIQPRALYHRHPTMLVPLCSPFIFPQMYWLIYVLSLVSIMSKNDKFS